ncbi:MAG: peptidoglycan DD-metalloendopeptidase family protein [Oscillospiraceae bacterium]
MTPEKTMPAQGLERKREKVSLSNIYDATAAMGFLFFTAFMAIGKALYGAVLRLSDAFIRGWKHISRFLKEVLAKCAAHLIAPYFRYKKALKIGQNEINKAKSEKGKMGGVSATAKVTGRMLFGKRGVLVTIVNWALPIASCIFLFNVISFANNQLYAIKLTVNGNFIGYIDDESVFNSAEKAVQKRINFTGSNTQIISFDPSYEVASIGYGSTLNSNQLTDKILELITDNIADGYGLYIGDQYYGTLSEHDKLNAALDEVLDKYRTGSEKETVAFDKEISFIPGKYMIDSFVDEDEMINLLTSFKKVASYYTVVDGDSAGLICDKVDMTFEELAALNPGYNAYYPVYGGQKIKITQDEPYLTVIVTREEHYNEKFDYETIYNDDSTIFEGDQLIRRAGSMGERSVVANVSYINGVEVNRHVISRTVTKEPVTRIVSVGTKPRTSNSAPAQIVEAGNYLWPVGGNGGKISCLPYMAQGGYQHAYYGHKGLDIAGSYGTPIYAAGSGTITFAGWNSGGYGNLVIIRHDDGKETYYGHMSTISSAVYVGKRVTMGECIGYMGSTGNSTGNHLHFEVRINGKPQWPLDYLPAHITEWGTYM